MHEQYSNLVTIKAWTTLAERIPESNLDDVGEQKNRNVMKCHSCGSEYHLKFNCPKLFLSDQQEGSGAGKTQETQKGSSDWRLIHTAEKNTIVTVNSVKFYFYKHCVYKKTKRQGF